MFNKALPSFALPISRKIVIAGAAFLFLSGFIFFIKQILQPPCCDADDYIILANGFNRSGIVETKESLRTFAYPWILSLFLKLSNVINLPFKFLVFLFQTFAYYAAIVFAAKFAARYSPKLSIGIYIALCLNFFVIPYTGVTLTDSLYISISIIIFILVLSAEHTAKGERLSNYWLFFMIFCLSLSVTIRPAAIWLFIPALYSVARAALRKNVAIENVLLFGILGCTSLYIQIYLNVQNFEKITFFPVRSLGSMQIVWGIENFKYSTWLGGGSPRNFYPSTELIKNTVGEYNTAWYFKNPLEAARLLTMKLIGAFDFDYVMPYPYRVSHSRYWRWAPSVLSLTILWLGIFAILFHAFTNKLKMLGSRLMPLLIFAVWCMFTLPTAIELRFTLPLLCFFIIAAACMLNYMYESKDKRSLILLAGGWVVFMPIFVICAKFIRMQSVILH